MCSNCPNDCVKSVQIESFFWSLFSRIPTEYKDLQSKSPYSVRIRENTDHINSELRHLPCSDFFLKWLCCWFQTSDGLEAGNHRCFKDILPEDFRKFPGETMQIFLRILRVFSEKLLSRVLLHGFCWWQIRS